MAISLDKGVMLCEQYFGKNSGEMFADFILKYFEEAFEKSNNSKDKLFVQDGDPSQNTRKANNAMYIVDAKKLSVPAGALT